MKSGIDKIVSIVLWMLFWLISILPFAGYFSVCVFYKQFQTLLVFIVLIVVTSSVVLRSECSTKNKPAFPCWRLWISVLFADVICLFIPVMGIILHVMMASMVPDIFNEDPWKFSEFKSSVIGALPVLGVIIAGFFAVASPLMVRKLPKYKRPRLYLLTFNTIIAIYGFVSFGVLMLLNSALGFEWADDYPTLAKVVLFPIVNKGYRTLFLFAVFSVITLFLPPFSYIWRAASFYTSLTCRGVVITVRWLVHTFLALSKKTDLPLDPDLASFGHLKRFNQAMRDRLEEFDIKRVAELKELIRNASLEKERHHVPFSDAELKIVVAALRDHERLCQLHVRRSQLFRYGIPYLIFGSSLYLVVMAFIPLVVYMRSCHDPQEMNIYVFSSSGSATNPLALGGWNVKISEELNRDWTVITTVDVSRYVIAEGGSGDNFDLSWAMPRGLCVDMGNEPVRVVGYTARVIPDRGASVSDHPLHDLEMKYPLCVKTVDCEIVKAYPHFPVHERPALLLIDPNEELLMPKSINYYRTRIILRLRHEVKDWFWENFVQTLLRTERRIRFEERKFKDYRIQKSTAPAALEVGDQTLIIEDSICENWTGNIDYRWVPTQTGEFTDPSSFSGLTEFRSTHDFNVRDNNLDIAFSYRTTGRVVVVVLLQLVFWPSLLVSGRSIFWQFQEGK